jgi:hypothetical protein
MLMINCRVGVGSMKRALIVLLLPTAATIVAFRANSHAPLGENGIMAAWLPMPEGVTVAGGNYDHADLEFDAGRGNARFRSSRTVAELKEFYEEWFAREGFAAVDGMHRVIVMQPTTTAFAIYACHRAKGRFLNIVGSEEATETRGYRGVSLVYWESHDVDFVQNLFGLKPGERPCDH